MKCENIGVPWANEGEFEKALAEAPDWADGESSKGVWTNMKVTLPGQHPFEIGTKPIAEQLGALTAKTIAILNANEDAASLISLLPQEKLHRSSAPSELVIAFVRQQQEVSRTLGDAAARLSTDCAATLWICHPRQPQPPDDELCITSMLSEAEVFGLANDAFLPVGRDWVCLRLHRS